MRILCALLLIVTQTCLAQNQADEFYDPQAMAEARQALKQNNGGQVNYLVLGERLENQFHSGGENLVWEAQGWVGTDLHKLWLKTEGHYEVDQGRTEEFELQALYSHPVGPFWDLQAGLRHDAKPGPSRDYLVIGLMGLAPYFFELDAAAFVSERGNVSARLEAEYELRFTQRLILQPRMEMNYSFEEVPELGLGRGISRSHLGLRLRYEVRREFAPYVGVSWERSFGGTADYLQRDGSDLEQFRAVAGIRFWY